jgi:hypothetical protein
MPGVTTRDLEMISRREGRGTNVRQLSQGEDGSHAWADLVAGLKMRRM